MYFLFQKMSFGCFVVKNTTENKLVCIPTIGFEKFRETYLDFQLSVSFISDHTALVWHGKKIG